eukprot:TRINITY_DN24657_c0_g1_i3.p1 TRINITY_DN24657_c0_g1~~TRINITY_DN24657_c0_g1_i3.p1  ORF type:complete len:102 (-),score=7.40 TRINITY_DN24657_c0_g1_i3:71-376(-)
MEARANSTRKNCSSVGQVAAPDRVDEFVMRAIAPGRATVCVDRAAARYTNTKEQYSRVLRDSATLGTHAGMETEPTPSTKEARVGRSVVRRPWDRGGQPPP